MDGEGQKSTSVQGPASGEIREDLVETAVKFLQNAKVRQSAFSQRRAFLTRKGLTEAEISEAVKRSGTAADETAAVPAAAAAAPNTAVSSSTIVPYNNQQAMPVVRTRWEVLRDVLNLATFIGGAIYALYLLYKNFLMKWLFGKSVTKSVKSKDVESLEKQMVDVTSNVSELKTLVSQTNEQVQNLARSTFNERREPELGRLNVTEIKDEIRSLKSLLLSKKQFPPIPSTSPVIPSWQLQAKLLKDSDSDTSSNVGEAAGSSEELKTAASTTSAEVVSDSLTLKSEISTSNGISSVNEGSLVTHTEDNESANESALQENCDTLIPELSVQENNTGERQIRQNSRHSSADCSYDSQSVSCSTDKLNKSGYCNGLVSTHHNKIQSGQLHENHGSVFNNDLNVVLCSGLYCNVSIEHVERLKVSALPLQIHINNVE